MQAASQPTWEKDISEEGMNITRSRFEKISVKPVFCIAMTDALSKVKMIHTVPPSSGPRLHETGHSAT